MDKKLLTLKTNHQQEIESLKSKIDILERKLQNSESKQDALLNSYNNNVSKLRNEIQEINTKFDDYEKLTHEVGLKLTVTEDTVSDT